MLIVVASGCTISSNLAERPPFRAVSVLKGGARCERNISQWGQPKSVRRSESGLTSRCGRSLIKSLQSAVADVDGHAVLIDFDTRTAAAGGIAAVRKSQSIIYSTTDNGPSKFWPATDAEHIVRTGANAALERSWPATFPQILFLQETRSSLPALGSAASRGPACVTVR